MQINWLEYSCDDERATYIRPSITILARQCTNRRNLVFACELNDFLDLRLELCCGQFASSGICEGNCEEFVLPDKDDVIVF